MYRDIDTLTIDFETKDYGIDDGVGPGWVWKGVNVLMAVLKIDDQPAFIERDRNKIIEYVNRSKTLVAHNAPYELGILKMWGVDLKPIEVFDTKVGAKLMNNLLHVSDLSSIGQIYVGQKKTTSELIEEAMKYGIVDVPSTFDKHKELAKIPGKEQKKAAENYKKQLNGIRNQAYSNLDILDKYSDVVATYCLQDGELTYKLHKFFLSRLDEKVYAKFSKLTKVVTEMRAKGVRIDIPRVYELMGDIRIAVAELERELYSTVGFRFNYNSHVQIKEFAKHIGVPGLIVEDDDEEDMDEEEGFDGLVSGKESFGKEWVKANLSNPTIQLFHKVKTTDKMLSFLSNVLKHEQKGRLHPLFNILTARTGRFSCSSPSVQNVPAHDDVWGKKMRSIFIPDEFERFYACDYSAQEPRLQVHFASYIRDALGGSVAQSIIQAFINNPNLDSYQFIVDAVNRPTFIRKHAKTILLGLTYGMGKEKLANSLQMNMHQANEVLDLFHMGAPHVKALAQVCQAAYKQAGYIRTLGGRKLRIKPGREYAIINYLIQGSAADQTGQALLDMYDEGIIPNMTIHDEIAGSATPDVIDRIHHIMENTVKLAIPTISGKGVGDNWGDCK